MPRLDFLLGAASPARPRSLYRAAQKEHREQSAGGAEPGRGEKNRKLNLSSPWHIKLRARIVWPVQNNRPTGQPAEKIQSNTEPEDRGWVMAKMIKQKETSWCRGDARAAMAWRNDEEEQRKEARASTSVAMDLRKYVRNIIQSRPVTTLSLPTCSAGHVADDTNQRHTKRGCVSKHTSKHTGKVTVSRGESERRSAIDAHNRDDDRWEEGRRTLHRTRLGGGAPLPTGWWRFKRGRGTGSSCAVVWTNAGHTYS